MEWLFNELGTLIIGLLLGGSSGSIITWKLTSKHFIQKQNAGEGSNQIQVGRDMKERK